MKYNKLLSVLIIITVLLLCLFNFGRSLWHPVYIKLIGGRTINEVTIEIESKKPYLIGLSQGSLSIIVIKDEKKLYLFNDEKLIDTIPVLAASGKLGPKIKRGDNQVPEGVYNISVLNSNSSYYLSAKISYPNTMDFERSNKLKVEDLGDDIYIHGKSASVGCIAIGDDKIEDLFYLLSKRIINKVNVIIAPVNFNKFNLPDNLPNDIVYDKVKVELKKYKL